MDDRPGPPEAPDYEYELDPDAANNTAAAILRMALAGGSRVLDLGSGPGIVSSHLERQHGRAVTCVDADERLLAVARSRGVTSTVVADLDEPGWQGRVGGPFDVVILADVLEHLRHPEAVLRAIVDDGLLADGGFVVVSIPNAAHEAVIAELLTGHFTYHPTGLLDRTHIRFFTLDSFVELAEGEGLAVTEVQRILRTLEQTEFRERAAELPADLRRILDGRGVEAKTYQLVMRLVPATAEERNVDLRRKAGDLEARVAELEAEVRRLNTEVAAAERERSETAVAAQQAANALQADLLRARRRAASAERRAERLAREIAEIRSSFTWKAGRKVKRAVDPAIAARNALARRRGSRPPTQSRPVVAPEPGPAEGGDPAAEAPPAVEPGSLAEPYPVGDDPLRKQYEREVRRHDFSGQEGGGPGVVMAVFTTDLSEGRGDVYVAAGIGRELRRSGARVAYLPQDSWADLPAGTDVVVAMLPTFEPSRVQPGVRCVAWVRNEADAWMSHPQLSLFDGVLASSEQSRAAIARVFAGPTGVLRIGVDTELFAPGPSGEQRHGVVGTVNGWGRERDVHRALRSTPVRFPLALYGHRGGLPAALAGHAAGPVSFFALPGLYRAAALVLDDFNHTTVGWGNVNSRVYEALACGALVLTNTGRGLDELGLGDVPSYGDTPLAELVEGLLADPAGTAALAGRLAEVVRTRHGYDSRAVELLAFVDGIDTTARTTRSLVAFYPGEYRVNNPYQDMLYGALGDIGAVAVPVAEDLDPTRLPELARADRARVLHIHWTAPILGPASSAAAAGTRVRHLLAGIDAFRASGGLVAWTVHNILPHECAHPTEEVELRQGLADRADLVHVMCEATGDAVSGFYTLPADRTVVVPHSSFVGVYGDALDRSTARRTLGIAADDIVLLALGGIRPYKGIDRLLAAFDQAVRTEPRLRLVVAGHPGRFDGVAELEQRCREHPRVVARFDRVEEDELQVYAKAADVAVLPHRAVLNSGALMLAYTFGLPAIAPATGCVAALLDPAASIEFDPGDDDSLAAALHRAGTLLGPGPARAARSIAERYTPADMAADFAAALARLTG